jgi:hypothetical protein
VSSRAAFPPNRSLAVDDLIRAGEPVIVDNAKQESTLIDAGVDLVLLQFSPQFEEMERFADAVIRRDSSLAAPA